MYLDRPLRYSQVLLKVTKVIIHNGEHTLETFVISDDGSERTILLQAAARLGSPGGPAAVRTQLGWTVQGPTKLVQHQRLSQ